MPHYVISVITIVIALGVATPVAAQQAGGFGNDGIYGCAGSAGNSIGREMASGPFVPVSEDAVSHNTNVLVYKECVLDGIANRVKESAVAFMVKASLKWINEGYNGAPAFVTNQVEFELQIRDKTLQQFNAGTRTADICEPFKRDVQESIERNYAEATRKPEKIYSCSVPDEKMSEYQAFIQGNAPFSWDMYLQSIQPENNPMTVQILAYQQLLRDMDQEVTSEFRELDWGAGYKSTKNCRQVPTGNGLYEEYCEIVTPGRNIVSMVNNLSQTSLDLTKNADEIDELMGSLMSNIHTEILTSVGGLRGITNSGSSGLGSYLDRVTQDSSARTRTEYTDTGTAYLTKSITIETGYKTARESSEEALTDTVEALKNKEDACWDSLIAQAKADLVAEVEERACAKAEANHNPGPAEDPDDFVCTIAGSARVENSLDYEAYMEGTADEYRIIITATAGDEEDLAILRRHRDNSTATTAQHINPLLEVVRQTIDGAKKALTILLNLQASLLGSNTPGNTRYVLQQADDLAASGVLHTEGDVIQAGEQHEDIVDTMEELHDETVESWEASWCQPTAWRTHLVN